eukprot:SAG31_NODE_3515_length_4170_cov_7.908131_6_plen_187_part_01
METGRARLAATQSAAIVRYIYHTSLTPNVDFLGHLTTGAYVDNPSFPGTGTYTIGILYYYLSAYTVGLFLKNSLHGMACTRIARGGPRGADSSAHFKLSEIKVAAGAWLHGTQIASAGRPGRLDRTGRGRARSLERSEPGARRGIRCWYLPGIGRIICIRTRTSSRFSVPWIFPFRFTLLLSCVKPK